MRLDAFVPMIGRTLRNPRGTARELLKLDLPLDALWAALVLVVILSVLLTGVADLMVPPPPEAESIAVLTLSPFAQVGLLASMQAALVLGLWRVGRGMGGQGSLSDTLLLMTFLQFVLLAAQLAQLVLMLLLPPIGGLFMIAVFFGAIVLLLIYVDEMHRFNSLGRSLLLFLLVSVGIGLVLMFLITLTGQTLNGAA
ncbi:Yip1 domain-containing protein [Tranquillimonas rosea]|uniref:Yip1 domain-containing protein n=1 Tax=Tranquillimonas rosea TaxID=641238 RepID=A0A1H9VI93_9RHOB|nr:YIP1 family protein [Tranquillimonas rosea]SES21231.1 Yip1 domain-containing protein [Tranquillimonas rosea]